MKKRVMKWPRPVGRCRSGTRFHKIARAGLALALLGFLPVLRAGSLTVIPERFTLSGPVSHQRLVVEQVQGKALVGPSTNHLEFTSSDTNVVRIEDGVARPIANGRATVRVKSGRDSARAEITVTGMEKPFDWSFRNHVQPVLAKFGCSSGACHGAAAGKNGFKLSLRGYDDEGDFIALTRNAMGRRIVPSDPGRSLLLLKPTGTVPHKGGQKFTTDSLEYKVLAEWIAAVTSSL